MSKKTSPMNACPRQKDKSKTVAVRKNDEGDQKKRKRIERTRKPHGRHRFPERQASRAIVEGKEKQLGGGEEPRESSTHKSLVLLTEKERKMKHCVSTEGKTEPPGGKRLFATG